MEMNQKKINEREDYGKNSQRLKYSYKRTAIRLIDDFTIARMEVGRQLKLFSKF